MRYSQFTGLTAIFGKLPKQSHITSKVSITKITDPYHSHDQTLKFAQREAGGKNQFFRKPLAIWK